MSKKAKPKKAIKVKVSKREYDESAACAAMLASWACAAFNMEPTPTNMRCIYRLAWTRAGEHVAMAEFIENPFGKQ